jgi:hypothetical protein
VFLLGNVDAYDQSGSGNSFYTLILRINQTRLHDNAS